MSAKDQPSALSTQPSGAALGTQPSEPSKIEAFRTDSRRAKMREVLVGRVPFWRAMIEMTLLITATTVGYFPFAHLVSSPYNELISFISLSLYVFAAWKLEPGQGGLWRRAGRVTLWVLLFSLINGVIGWACLAFLPWKANYFGVPITPERFNFLTSVLGVAFIIATLIFPARLLLAVWAMGRRRLRWQLTFSYLLIGILTNFFVPLTLFAYIAIISLSSMPTLFAPAELAPTLASAITPTVRSGVLPGELDPLFAGLLDGSTRVPLPPGEDVAAFSDLDRGGVRRLSLLRPDGTVLAASGDNAHASGEPLPATIAPDFRLLLDTVLAEGGCRDGNPAGGPLGDTAVCAIVDAAGAPLALLVVESNVDSAAQFGAAFGRIITVTLLGFSLTLNVAILVVIALIPVALGIGYQIARRLTRRIERLTEATAGVAAGDLGRRVVVESQDEIGRLGENFNAMALQLAERERALADTAARAEALLRANRRLVADVSHELRNPLATLRGYLEALELSHKQSLPPDDMRVIQGEVARLTSLVDDLFTLARAEAKQLPLTLAPVDVGTLVERLAAALGPLARRERQIELVAQIAPALPHALADSDRLEQVLRNLAQNALRHTPPGGIVAFEVKRGPGECLQIAVADTGVGIEPDDLPLIFERFYRSDSSRTRETGGAGLGLSLVRELVGAMNGTVVVESSPGRGSRFTVTLPVATDAA